MPPEAAPDRRWTVSHAMREGGKQDVAAGLHASRERTLALLAACEAALGPSLRVPYSTQLNPPLWETGHVGWFQDWWIARNRQRALGAACDPEHARPEGRLAGADALYDSGRVAHPTRWKLPLPDAAATRAYLAAGIKETLALLAATPETADDLYFFRLVLFHEDMHAEAATYMAQALGIALPADLTPIERSLPPADSQRDRRESPRDWRDEMPRMGYAEWRLGYDGPGFAFDNELAAHAVQVPAFEIDAVPVTWQRYLPFVEAGGYDDARWWSAEGWQWREAGRIEAPRYLRRVGGDWQRQRFGRWDPLRVDAAAVHLTQFEAEAWCRWAGRRLPTEAEWETAAMSDKRMAWGDVWEWTASRFLPYPGFKPHPYRDYSAPWFGSRYVLRGAAAATSPRIVHRRYRNYFTPERNDIYAGFRSCARADGYNGAGTSAQDTQEDANGSYEIL